MEKEIKQGLEEILIDKALTTRERAQCDFSGFKVGAALLCKSGNIFTGCNIENPSLGLSICAERVALVKAISEGQMAFEKIAIVADTEFFTYPCGSCRQMLWECEPTLQILLSNMRGGIKKMMIGDLLPHAFDFKIIRGDGASKKIREEGRGN